MYQDKELLRNASYFTPTQIGIIEGKNVEVIRRKCRKGIIPAERLRTALNIKNPYMVERKIVNKFYPNFEANLKLFLKK